MPKMTKCYDQNVILTTEITIKVGYQ